MNSLRPRNSTSILTRKPVICTGVSLLILAILSACNPAGASVTPIEVQKTPLSVESSATAVLSTPTLKATSVPTLSPKEELTFPYYLPLVTRLDIPTQTIDGVTTNIDWIYIDEGRVALHYTISGLDWPDGSTLDGMQQVRIQIPALADAKFGGFSGGSGGSSSYAENGVISGDTDQFLLDGALDAEKYPSINLNVDIPVEGPTKVGTFHFSFSAPVADGFKIENIDQTVRANDVSMTLKSLIVTPSYAQALICFQMPSAVDWGLTASTIIVGGHEFAVSGAGLASAKNDPNSALTASERCNDVGFNILYDPSDTSITLTVPKLTASVNEVVTKETVAMANQRLAAKGIEFDYVNIDHGGNIVVLKKPDALSDAETGALIWDALAEQYEGPWMFTLEIPK